MMSAMEAYEVISDKLNEAIGEHARAAALGNLNLIAYSEGKVVALTLIRYLVERDMSDECGV